MKKLVPWIKVSIGVALMVLIARELDLELFTGIAGRWGDFSLFASLGVLFYFFGFSCTVLRWRLLLHGFQVPARVRDVYRLGFIGQLFSQVIPGATGGDVVKGFYVARETPERRVEAVTSVIVDRLIGMAGLLLLGGVTFALYYENVSASDNLMKLFGGLAIAAAALVVGALLVSWESLWKKPFIARWSSKLPGRKLIGMLATALWALKRKPGIVALSLGLSVMNHAILVVVHLFLWRALLGEFPPISTFFFLVPVGLLAMGLPLSPGGLGVGETAFKHLFDEALLGHGAELALLNRMVILFWAAVGLVFYFRGKKELKEAMEAAEKEGVAPA